MLVMNNESASAIDKITETAQMICQWAERRLATGKPLSASERDALEKMTAELRSTADNLREMIARSDDK
jgi:hypothetical protein